LPNFRQEGIYISCIRGIDSDDMSNGTSSRIIAGGARDKERVVRLLRRGTNTLEVQWSQAAMGPIKDIRKERFLGLAKDINIRLTMGQLEVGLEGERAIVLKGTLVESCYWSIPKGFRFSSFAPSQDPVGQEEIDRRAEATSVALGILAADLKENPGSYSIGFGYPSDVVMHL
jgi:hypothetical protein